MDQQRTQIQAPGISGVNREDIHQVLLSGRSGHEPYVDAGNHMMRAIRYTKKFTVLAEKDNSIQAIQN